MANIALIWELGADLGHISRYLVIGNALRQKGHRPILFLKDISRAHTVLANSELEYFQAPLWLPPVQGLPSAINFAETLFLFGFLDPNGLTSLCKAWRALWNMAKIDLLIFDQSPSALLASKGLGTPKIITGNSFAIPPQQDPWPVYKFWEKNNLFSRQHQSEKKLVSNANQALSQISSKTISSAKDLFQADFTLLAGSPELDVYGPRENVEYIGAINVTSQGTVPIWPFGYGKKIFCYIKPTYPLFQETMQLLKKSENSVIVFSPGISKSDMAKFESATLTVSSTPYRMSDVLAQCDFGICHSGGTADVLLNSKKPVLMLPIQMEQTMTGKIIEAIGCGLSPEINKGIKEIERAFKRLSSDNKFYEATASYAERNSKYLSNSGVDIFVERCESLLSPTSK